MTNLLKGRCLHTFGPAILAFMAMQSVALAVVISPNGVGSFGIINYQAGNVALQSNGSIASFVAPATTGFGGNPDRGNDGNTDGNFGGNSVLHNNDALAGQAWRVTMNAEYAISNVEIFNRLDCCSDRFTNFNLVRTNGLGSTTQNNNYGGDAGPHSFAQPNNTIVKSLDVVQLNNQYLNLAEIRLDGQPNLTLGSDSLQIEISNLGNDFIDVDGNAVLNGNVNVSLLGGYIPTNPVSILTAANINTTNMLLNASGGTSLVFRIINGGNGQILQVFAAPEPQSIAVWTLLGVGALGVVVAWRKRR